jgi:DNA-binding cell septation regulator SpoVG
MSAEPRIDNIRFAPARAELRAKGMLGWVCCALDGNFQLDGLALRRTADGRYVLSFPSRVDSNGVQHDYIKPLSNGVRDAIQAQVIGTLRKRGYIT